MNVLLVNLELLQRIGSASSAADNRRVKTEEPSARTRGLLRLLAREGKRGRLKVYLGQAAGVGRPTRCSTTRTRCARAAIDVVVGFVETHGRQETADRIGDLEVVPRRTVDYKGTVLHGDGPRRHPRAEARGRHRRRAGAHERPGEPEREAVAGRRAAPRSRYLRPDDRQRPAPRRGAGRRESATGLEIKERVPTGSSGKPIAVVNVDLPVSSFATG